MKINNGRSIMSRRSIRNLYIFGAMFMMLISISIPLLQVFANEDRGESKVKENYGIYAEDMENTYEVYGKLAEDIPSNREDTFRYLMSRILVPGYMNDVSTGVGAKNADMSTIVNGSVCDPNAPNNLISTNCDIPNFSSQLVQSVMRVLDPGGIEGGERVSAKSLFNWGVPSGIPGGTVPITPNQRTHKYTGLELFGYNVNYTDYNGEWDDIIPSTRARMLANFGFMDTLNLTGTSIWNGVTSGMGSLIEGFSWNPTTWLGNIESAFEASASGTFLTIVDTSDMNVATTRGWVRSGKSVASSYYNIKVLTDKEVMEESSVAIAHLFRRKLEEAAENDPHLKYVLSMQNPPNFTFDPNLESEESKKARADANAKNEKIDKENEAIREYNREVDAHNEEVKSSGEGTIREKKSTKDKVKVPEKEFVPEEVQFADWKKTDARVAEGESVGITCEATANISEFQTCWGEKYTTYQKAEFNVSSSTVTALIKAVKESLFEENPHSDPTQAISHYVCTAPNGAPMRGDDGKYVYLYSKENEGSKEFVNPKCGPVRASIQGGYLGDGYNTDKITDTRHISNIESSGFLSILPIVGSINRTTQDFFMNISKFIAQLINEMLNLAFSPLMSKLGISEIVGGTIESLKNTIFFPIAVIVIAASALGMLFTAIRSGSLITFFTSCAAMLLVFVISIFLFQNPQKVVDFLDEGPAKAEQFIASLILNQDNSDGLCTTTATDDNAGVRSAQCHVWSSLVYQPWTFGQWGVSHNKLDDTNFKNTNENLVGDASVVMGGGTTINNWAAYQLDLMTSGTLTTEDKTKPVGQADPKLYQIVDLQAGINNGAGTDSKYFSTWTGKDSSRGLIAFQSAILSIFMLIVLGGILISKIELTFIFSIMLLGLPFMLLYGLTNKGRTKLLGYIATLGSLLLKRMVATVMISLMLLMINVATADNADSYSIVFIGGMIILGFFKLYKKEIFALFKLDSQDVFSGEGLMSGDPDAIKQVVSNSTPLAVKNQLYMAKHKAIGGASGAIGGAIGGGGAVLGDSLRRRRDEYSANAKDKKYASKYGNVYTPKGKEKFIRQSPTEALATFRDAVSSGAHDGLHKGVSAQSRRADLALTRQGLDIFSVKSRVKNDITRKGSDRITGEGEMLAGAIHAEIESLRVLQDRNKRTLDPAYQKKVREMADEVSSTIATREANSLTSLGVRKIEAMSEIAAEQDTQLDKDITSIRNRNPFNLHKLEDNVTLNDSVKVSSSVDEIVEKGRSWVGKYDPNAKTKDNKEDSMPIVDNSLTMPDLDMELNDEISQDPLVTEKSLKLNTEDEVDESLSTHEDLVSMPAIDGIESDETQESSPKKRILEELALDDIEIEHDESREVETQFTEVKDENGVISFVRESTVNPTPEEDLMENIERMMEDLDAIHDELEAEAEKARESMEEEPTGMIGKFNARKRLKNNLGGDINDDKKD